MPDEQRIAHDSSIPETHIVTVEHEGIRVQITVSGMEFTPFDMEDLESEALDECNWYKAVNKSRKARHAKATE